MRHSVRTLRHLVVQRVSLFQVADLDRREPHWKAASLNDRADETRGVLAGRRDEDALLPQRQRRLRAQGVDCRHRVTSTSDRFDGHRDGGRRGSDAPISANCSWCQPCQSSLKQ